MSTHIRPIFVHFHSYRRTILQRQLHGFKGRIKFDFPWLGFGCVETFAGIVFREAAFEIVRMAPVEFAGEVDAFKDVCVKHKIKEGWPAIRSSEPG